MEINYSFTEDVKIYDTDAQGIVHYAGYYRFFTDTMQEFLRTKGFNFPFIDDTHWFVVLESNAKYINSAKIGDKIVTTLKITQLSKKILKFEFNIKRDGDAIAEGYLLHICINPKVWKSTEIPQSFLDRLSE